MSNKKEYAIGETVQMGLVTLVCVNESDCYGCELYHLNHSRGGDCSVFIGECEKEKRTDNKDVIFKLKINEK